MAQYAGRRVVLLLSEGLYISPRLTSAGKAAIRQNVSIYAIDAAGFTGDAHAQNDLMAWADFNSASRFDADLRLLYHESDRTKGLGPIAWWTGGFTSPAPTTSGRPSAGRRRTGGRAICWRIRRRPATPPRPARLSK